MSKILLLDTGILGLITHPRPNPEIVHWMERLQYQDIVLKIPEIVDYELRRKLLHLEFLESVSRLDALREAIGYIPLTTHMMLKAAEFWAEARKQGRPTAAENALDGDMILSAQATVTQNENSGDEVVIVTDNVGHLTLFSNALKWQEI